MQKSWPITRPRAAYLVPSPGIPGEGEREQETQTRCDYSSSSSSPSSSCSGTGWPISSLSYCSSSLRTVAASFVVLLDGVGDLGFPLVARLRRRSRSTGQVEQRPTAAG